MIAIGALGGSGTRAVAEVLIQSGFYMGDDLNRANDNLVFTRLFKNPDWYKNTSYIQKQKRFRIFEKYMSKDKLSFLDIIEVFSASKSNPTFRSDSEFYFRLMKNYYSEKRDTPNWGWKEPNTQIYMGELLKFFTDLKYVHVLRHGLDMAFSKNKQQLKNWGWKYNITVDGKENDNELAIKQLDYWIESTRDVIQNSKKYTDRFLLISHTDFCENPKSEIDKLLEFVGSKILDKNKEKLYNIPKNTGSNNRHMDKDLSIFDNKKLKFVQDMGFEI